MKELERAFIEDRITLEQFIEVLVENFGVRKTRKILMHNLKLQMEKEKVE